MSQDRLSDARLIELEDLALLRPSAADRAAGVQVDGRAMIEARDQAAIRHFASLVFEVKERRSQLDPRSGRTEPADPTLAVERSLPRYQRQEMIASWAELAFGREEATGLPQRGLRLLEEAIEAFQACGGDGAIAHKLVSFVFERPPGEVGQELGGVAVCVLALAAAAGVDADEEECREIHRVLSKPLGEFTQRNASKNAAGFKIP